MAGSSRAPLTATLITLGLTLISTLALAETPERKGFTIKLSMGAGAYMTADSGSLETSGGLGGLNLELGGFVHPDWAVTFKVAGVNYGPFTDAVDVGVAASFGPSVQWWPHDRVQLELGAGVGALAVSHESRVGSLVVSGSDVQAGFSVMVGAGVSILQLKHHALGLYAEYAPIFASAGVGMTLHGGVMWQYY